jgi:hypothetical protein
MRISHITVAIAAIVAIPLAVNASGPQMSSEQFLSSVRCVAYEDLGRAGEDLGVAKMRLNSEARRQPVDTTAQAHAEVGAIAVQAAGIEGAEERAALRRQRTSACSAAALAAEI